MGVVSAANACADLRQTPDRVMKDMNFLKDSWANMAEEEEVIQQNEETTENALVQHDDGFQVSMSKHQKKAIKKRTQSSKESYATRSKGNSKPFK
jgi:GTP cyclohydrolase I